MSNEPIALRRIADWQRRGVVSSDMIITNVLLKELAAVLDTQEARAIQATRAVCLAEINAALARAQQAERERDAAREALENVTDDDAMTDIIQSALVELGVRTRLDTGESMREFCNSIAGEIIDALRQRFRSARAALAARAPGEAQ